ncbi:MAG: acylphosphatase [Chloroflexi bacterium]|nr:MAG: acylphosphatase [Chloroflexota bacterium]MBL1193426.1 acylphosphatase [Chloroflexota bacterium]NOH10718.1 acylphosphatase [Chloroflexota bacterium]
MERIHATVKGRVQGVSFRFFVQQNASRLELAGWVRNRLDSSVELVAEGEKGRLEELIMQLHQGPLSSRVDNVAAEWGQASSEFSRFVIKPTR